MYGEPKADIDLPDTTIDGVTQDTAAAQVGTIDPQRQFSSLDFLVQSKVRYAGFDDAGCIVCVDVEDLVHPTTKVDDDGPGDSWSGASVADVASHGNRVDWDFVLVRPAGDFLHFLRAGRVHDGAGDQFFLVGNVVCVVRVARCRGSVSSDLALPCLAVAGRREIKTYGCSIYHPSTSGLSLSSTFSWPMALRSSAIAWSKFSLDTPGGSAVRRRATLSGSVFCEYSFDLASMASCDKRDGTPLYLAARSGIEP